MENEASAPLPFRIITGVWSTESRARVVAEVVNRRGELSPTTDRRLRDTLRRRLRVPGFARPDLAPVPILRQALERGLQHASDVTGALIAAWVEMRGSLGERTRQFLAARGVEPVGPGPDGFRRLWSVGEMEALVEPFVAAHPEVDRDEAALMLCWQSGCVAVALEGTEPSDGDAGEPATGGELPEQIVSSTAEAGLLARWLDELAALPAGSGVWDDVPGFLEQVTDLAQRKSGERSTRGQLAAAIERLRTEAESALQLFEFSGVSAWDASVPPLEACLELTEQVNELAALLLQHQELWTARVGSLREDRIRRERLGEIEPRIAALHQLLEPSLGRPAAAAPVHDASVPPVSEAPPVDERVTHEASCGEAPPEAPAEREASSEATYPPSAVAELTVELPTGPSAPAAQLPEIEYPVAPAPFAAEDATGMEESVEGPAAPTIHAPSSEPWQRLLFVTVSMDDVAAAYWIARALEAGTGASSIPSWLLAAVQGARWLRVDSDALVTDLIQLTATHQPDPDDEVQHWMGLAAGLQATLVAPATGLVEWLRVPSVPAALRGVVEPLVEFAALGQGLHPDDLEEVTSAAAREERFRRQAAEATQFLEGAPRRKTKLQRATLAWKALVRDDLRALLLPVVQDRRSSLEEVRARLREWENPRALDVLIDEVDARLTGKSLDKIVGDPRNQLHRGVQEAREIAATWCRLVQHEQERVSGGRWRLERAQALRGTVERALPDAEDYLAERADARHPVGLATVARCVMRALGRLHTILRLPPGRVTPGPELGQDRVLQAMLADERLDLERALARRLLWLPELALDAEGRPSGESLLLVPGAVEAALATHRSLADAFRGWLERQDFRFVVPLTRALADHPELPALERLIDARREEARATLRAEAASTEEAIEQAVVDGIIADEERAELAAATQIDLDAVQEFASRLQALAAARDRLLAGRNGRLAGLRREWEETERHLSRRYDDPRWESVRSTVNGVFARGETRVAYECLERLRPVLEGRANLAEAWPEHVRDRDEFGEFLETLPALEEALRGGMRTIPDWLRTGAGSPVALEAAAPLEERLGEIKEAVRAWLDLKGQDGLARIAEDRLRTVLPFVGFAVPPDAGALRVINESRDWVHLRVRMSARGASPVPQFGSQAREQFNVVCVRERPGVDLLAPVLRDLATEGHPTLVVYLGRLPMPQRRALTGLTRPRHQPLVVLDELLLLFLTREPGPRLPVFLRCAVPYSAVNPFTPFQAGDVPPETFFGRRSMAQELARPEGTCLVYGGRQLGKSALLRHVERHLHQPGSGMYARVVDIKLIGDPLSDPRPDALWRRLRDTLKEMTLLPASVTSDQPDRIQRHVRDLVLQRSDVRRLTVLFDEADSFLDADAREGFGVVTELRDLMAVSQRRFKVVFAGLQNVQRFQGIPNQPLAHFGQALLVGPLEPADAEDLIRETFRALGFRFTDRTVILRILSYTNYHPGLIQLFCQELLRSRRAAVGATLPPHDITADDVERVYRQPSVRDGIRERFDWTLALDPRYQCITWALIVDQLSERDGYARAYAPAEAQELARFWWKAGFQDVAFDRFRGLLDEMWGLGVLVRQADGRYRLRSPNLVPLMGRDRDIEARLLEIAQRPAALVFEADSHHAALDDGRRYSPLTYAQERTALARRYGVVLVIGSRSLGLDAVPEALRRSLRVGEPGEGERLVEVPEELVQGPALREWLRRHEAPAVIQLLRGSGGMAAERVEVALEWCRARSRGRGTRWSRVIFLMDPRALWEWLALEPARIEDLESLIDGTITLGYWNAAGLRRRLEQHEKISSDIKVKAALEGTGGWPVLLDALLERSRSRDDVQPAAEALNTALASPGDPLAREFLAGLGLDVWPGIRPVLHFVRTLGEVGPDELLPELIETPERLDPELCRRVMDHLSRLGILTAPAGRWRVDPVVARVLAAESP